jgi:DNA-binding XRE family transcriptional regulator
MNKNKIKNLEKKGWKVGTVAEFLNLSREEEEYIEMKLALSKYLQKLRKKKHLTQVQFAAKIKSSQSRVAKIERAESSVSLDLIVRSIIALGSSKKEIGKIILANTV